MKKWGLIVLLTIYATASFGVSIQQFYCCNQLKSTSISFVPAEENSCGMKHKMKDCCKTKVKFVKQQDTHFAQSAKTVTPFLEHYEPLHFFTDAEITELNSGNQLNSPIHGPPLIHSGVSLYQFYCNYRI
ncbi:MULTISPECIES: HYC_CC_PP family protein [Sediminibacterium]|uniref:HYC_CC_PP family protein n=1 Tax=Sediminibacterium TaxID=504481 RepID=UPI000479DF2B|nr:hypothetical protein [Sediminibacterium salmoneum]